MEKYTCPCHNKEFVTEKELKKHLYEVSPARKKRKLERYLENIEEVAAKAKERHNSPKGILTRKKVPQEILDLYLKQGIVIEKVNDEELGSRDFICSKGHKFNKTSSTLKHNLTIHTCPQCDLFEYKRKRVLEIAQKHNINIDLEKSLELSPGIWNESQISIICSKGHVYNRKVKGCTNFDCFTCNKEAIKEKYTKLLENTDLTIIDCQQVEDKDGNNRWNFTLRCNRNHEFTKEDRNVSCSCSECLSEDVENKYIELVKTTDLTLLNCEKTKNYRNEKARNLVLQCKNGHIFNRIDYNLINYKECPICNGVISKGQLEIFDFIKQTFNTSDLEQNNTKVLGGLEIDVYSDSLKIGIEFHGNYWHSYTTLISLGKSIKEAHFKHSDKAKLAIEKGIKLIQIFEDEWLYKKDIVKNLLRNAFGDRKQEKIDARKCEIKLVSFKESEIFQKENHIHGPGLVGTIRLGLYFKDKLHALLTFEKGGSSSKNIISTNPKEFELYKYCTDANVRGGLSRLLEHFKKEYQPEIIRTYCDRRFFTGKGFENLGFKVVGITEPNYYYFNRQDLIRKHRYNFRTRDGITEKERTKDLLKIYDAGHLKLVWQK